MSKLLESINLPKDLRTLSTDKLPIVAQEIREFLIEKVSLTGGHLASSLGVVDLTIALHYVYDTPVDKLVWDVGHQAYAHKVLTGRKEKFDSLRQFHGISGFPRISESEYDALSVGHASTSISAALGMAIARDLNKDIFSVAAIIGDGSLSGGLAFEGLNNLGSSNTNLTVIVNDNKMSIAKNVGALSRYLTRVLTDKRYNKLRSDIWELTGKMHNVGQRIRAVIRNIDETLKHMVIPGKLFEDMGLNYLGPVNGHNIPEMIEVLKFARSTSGPHLVHVITQKGKGYDFAEQNSIKFHGVGSFSIDTGDVKQSSQAQSYSEVFGKHLVELARDNQKIVAITAAMPDGTSLNYFAEAFPNRFFDVGIAEEHAVSFASGLALCGSVPVVALYSTFLQRAYDQIIHDVALDNLHVVFCIDRAGLVGEDGPTHHGVFDVSYLRTIPNLTIMAPSTGYELKEMLRIAVNECTGPVCIRYPRGSALTESTTPQPVVICEPHILHKGKKIAILALGDTLKRALDVQKLLVEKNIFPTIVNPRFIKPVCNEFYRDLFKNHSLIVTIENNILAGGYGSLVLELISKFNMQGSTRVIRFGYPDEFIVHGSISQLLSIHKLDSASIAARICEEQIDKK